MAVTHRHAGTFDGGYEEMPCEANARLIAAAPDLLQALERIAFEPFGPADATHEQVLAAVTEFARTAIKKARGGR